MWFYDFLNFCILCDFTKKRYILFVFIAKEKREAENGNGKVEEMDVRPVRERILSVVCPLADKTYEQQLEIKKTAIGDILKQFREKFMRTNGFFRNHNIGKCLYSYSLKLKLGSHCNCYFHGKQD